MDYWRYVQRDSQRTPAGKWSWTLEFKEPDQIKDNLIIELKVDLQNKMAPNNLASRKQNQIINHAKSKL